MRIFQSGIIFVCWAIQALFGAQPIQSEKQLNILLTEINQPLPCKKENVTRFYLVRHGESIANKEKILAGQTLDVDLTNEGEKQALALGDELKTQCFDKVFSSPKIRTKKTASLLLSQQASPSSVQEDSRLLERHSGKFEGRAMDGDYRALKKAGEAKLDQLTTFEEKFSFKFDPNDPLEESQKDVFKRVNAFLEEKHTAQATHGKTILVVTHNGIMKALFMQDLLKNHQADLAYHHFALANCGLMIVDVADTGSQVVYVQGVKFY